MDIEYIKNKWTMRSQDPYAGVEAWDSVADEYVYDGKVNFTDDSFLRRIESKVELTADLRVLDVGCGAGAYSIALAEKVGQVIGVDYSPKMVQLANRYADEHGISNAAFLERNWYTCDGDEFKGKFDLVFAHTTPAIADYATFMKMAEASGGHGFLCKPARRTDEIYDQLKRLVGLETNGGDDSVAYAFDTLWSMGCNPELSYDRTVWRSERTLEDAMKWYLGRLCGLCKFGASEEGKVRDFLEAHSRNGIIRECINTMLVTIYWSV